MTGFDRRPMVEWWAQELGGPAATPPQVFQIYNLTQIPTGAPSV